MRAVGSIMMDYDTDKNIPLLGFGARMSYIDTVMDCFAVNGNIFAPEIHGLENAVECYRKNLMKIQLFGPTNFAPIIRYISSVAEFFVTNKVYYNYIVLLIITDGQITDFDDTVDEIVKCSTLPVSIIIVGVGDADFKEMDLLDADLNPLYSKKYKMPMNRDIVQFVPFKKYMNNPIELAKQTLAELPRQFVDYMVSHGIPPGIQSAGSMPTVDTALLYTARRQDLINRAAQYSPYDQIERLLSVGFPTEDLKQFLTALQRGFSNILAVN